MLDPMNPDLFTALALFLLALLGIMLASAMTGVAFERWRKARKRRAARQKVEEVHTGAILLAGQMAAKTVKITKVKAGRTRAAKAVSAATDVLREVDRG
jgi:hypothetical protein